MKGRIIFGEWKNKAVFSFLILLLATSISVAGNYYVRNSGSDGKGGQSDSDAWKTISKVNSASLQSGDIVYFKRGNTWTGTQLRVKAGVTYDAYGSGDLPHISTAGNSGGQSPAAYNSGGSNAKLFHLKLTGGSDLGNYAAVISGSSSYSEIAHCMIISTAASYSAYVCGIGNATGTRCKNVHHCVVLVPYGVGIHGQGCGGCTYKNNTITSGDMPIKIGDGCADKCSGGNLVERNYLILNNKVPEQWGLTLKSVGATIVRLNVVDVSGSNVSTASGAISMVGGAHGVSNAEIYNNTLICDGSIEYGIRSSASSAEIRNNIIQNFNTGIAGSGMSSSHNAFYKVNTPCSEVNCGSSVSLSAQPFLASGNKPSPWYRLNTKSGGGAKCGNAGVNSDPDIPKSDFDGVDRNGGQWIGAFESPKGGAGVQNAHKTTAGMPRLGDLPHLLSNPLDHSILISYRLYTQGSVSLKIYDTAGRLLATPVNRYKYPGQYNVKWNMNGASPAVYLVSLHVGKTSVVKRVAGF